MTTNFDSDFERYISFTVVDPDKGELEAGPLFDLRPKNIGTEDLPRYEWLILLSE